jgi:hypothetical protein
MTLPVLIGLGAALGFPALRWTAEYFFHLVFGYIGAGVVRLITLGRVRMDLHHATESELASGLGLVFTVVMTGGLLLVFQPS